jgi:predicted dehydrogenase
VAAPYFVPSSVFGANDRLGIAVIGPGRQGGGLLASAGKSSQARIVAIADVNLPRARKAAEKYKATVYKDYRKLLEQKDVDAVITATKAA